MQFDTTLISGVLAALAAVFAALYAKRGGKKLEVERLIQASNLRGQEEVHRRKVAMYADAFEITERLSKRFILTKDIPVEEKTFVQVKADLISWSAKCGPILNEETLKSFRALLESLSSKPKPDGYMSRQCKNQVWRKKNWFRGCLKAELKTAIRIDA